MQSMEHHGVQPTAAWTTNRSLLVASHVRPFQEDRPIPTRPYPELRTWMVVRSGVISVFPTHSGNAPAPPDIRPTTWLCPACLPSTNWTIGVVVRMSILDTKRLTVRTPASICFLLEQETYPQCFSRLSCEMSTWWGQPREGCSVLWALRRNST